MVFYLRCYNHHAQTHQLTTHNNEKNTILKLHKAEFVTNHDCTDIRSFAEAFTQASKEVKIKSQTFVFYLKFLPTMFSLKSYRLV